MTKEYPNIFISVRNQSWIIWILQSFKMKNKNFINSISTTNYNLMFKFLPLLNPSSAFTMQFKDSRFYKIEKENKEKEENL